MCNQKISTLVAAAVVATTLAASAAQAQIRYVDDDAPVLGNGLSWDTAYKFLQDALADASSGGIAEIRVAQGTYKPDQGEAGNVTPGDREATFHLVNGVALLGGFAGVGAPTPDERDIELYETILSGDLLGNDVPGTDEFDPSKLDNSYHVIVGSGTDASAILDGLIIRAGVTVPGGTGDNSRGAGLFNNGGSPTVRNCTFTENGGKHGGGMCNRNASHPTIVDCQFLNNAVEQSGGGIMNESGSSPTITDCSFENNVGRRDGGGAIVNLDNSDPSITGCTFIGNKCFWNSSGGAIRNRDSSPTIVNCTFNSNEAAVRGGAITAEFNSNLSVTGCLFFGNVSFFQGGGAVALGAGAETYSNCLFSANIATDDGGAILGGNEQTVIRECTIMNNTAHERGGGMATTGSPIIIDCTFVGNTADDSGGALFVDGGQPRIIRCTIRSNTADNGGGLYNLDGGHALVVNSVFAGNTAMFFAGGGVYNEFSSNPKFVNCLFTGNTSAWRGAAMTNGQASAPQIIGCTFSLNIAAITCGGIYNLQSSAPVIVNTILWGNSDTDGATDTEGAQILNDNSTAAVDFSCIEGWTGGLGGLGNISDDPSFVDPDGTDNLPGTVDDDTRLQSGSPCIDSGHNWAVPSDSADLDGDADTTELTSLDLDGNPRFADDPATPDTGAGIPAVVDIGAYEFPGIRARCIFPNDVTGDGAVNVLDLIQLLLCFGQHAVAPSPCALADFNVDGSVNVLDLIDLLLAFGTACA